MIPIIHFLASALVWLTIFLFAKFNWGVTSDAVLTTTIVALGVIIVFFGLNTLRLAFKSNVGVLVVVLLLNIASLFAIDYFMAGFTIVSVSAGVMLGFIVAVIFLGDILARKTILGDRAQL